MNNKGIVLDLKRGLNASICYCLVCGGETNELALPGHMRVYKCPSCDMVHYGKPMDNSCQRCGATVLFDHDFDGEKEKLQSSAPCAKCTEILKTGCIGICNRCHNMFRVEAHSCLKPFEMGTDAESIQDAIDKGFIERVTGVIIPMTPDQCTVCEKEKK